MSKSIFLSFLYIFSMAHSCEEVDFENNSRYKISGTLVDENNQPVPNIMLIVKSGATGIDFNEDSIYSQTYYGNGMTDIEIIQKVTTDEAGFFVTYFPNTDGVEYLSTEETDLLEFTWNSQLISDTKLFLTHFDENDQWLQLGTIQYIAP